MIMNTAAARVVKAKINFSVLGFVFNVNLPPKKLPRAATQATGIAQH